MLPDIGSTHYVWIFSMKHTFLGRPKWQITLAVVCIAQLFTSAGFSLVFPFLPLYVEDLGSVTGLSVEWMAGLVISAQGITMMIASPLWGAAADRYGRKLMVMRAMFGGSVLMLLMGLVTNGEQLILLRAVQGFVTGTVAANNALVAAAVPRDRVGFSMGTLQVSLWGGIALGPLMGGVLADAFGYSMPFFITSIALLFSGTLIFFGIDEQFQPRPQTDTDPTAKPGLLGQWQHVMDADGVKFVYLLRFLSGVGRMMIVPIAPLFVVSLLPPNATNESLLTGAVIAVASFTATFSGVYLGRLGDKIGHRAILIGASAAAIVFYLPQALVANVWQLLALQALAGFATGGVLSAPSALLASYTQPGEEGATYGLDNSISSGARATAPLIGATIASIPMFGLRGTFTATALLFGIVVLIATLYLPDDNPQHVVHQPARAVGD